MIFRNLSTGYSSFTLNDWRSNMFAIAIGIAVLSSLSLLVAWREYQRSNPRDATVLAGFGALCAAGAGAVWTI
jgi:hypothetical protein